MLFGAQYFTFTVFLQNNFAASEGAARLASGDAPVLEGPQVLKKSVLSSENAGCLTSAGVFALPFATLVSSWLLGDEFFFFFRKSQC